MKRSCWGCKYHFTVARRTEGGIYLDSNCGKYDQKTTQAPEELQPGCYEALSLKREKLPTRVTKRSSG